MPMILGLRKNKAIALCRHCAFQIVGEGLGHYLDTEGSDIRIIRIRDDVSTEVLKSIVTGPPDGNCGLDGDEPVRPFDA